MVLSILRKAATEFRNSHLCMSQSFHHFSFDGAGLTLHGLLHDCGSASFEGLDCREDFLFRFLKMQMLLCV